ncbi:peptidase M28-like protein [Pontibacter ummariensis]|uniref:Peptidase family M28 n=1 Tax=Pontibacter ummariensis TaxID=1610492 RepID=A0A239CG49_9BACT|nr:M28 family metallopeptidase [Pontibacter ummariensis]PRY15028.1 peptidase M28-like protein [Pontibacter ummariensis]SNS19206.1 Peptidase family M28 [Pontibacter ummariensis]
MTYKSNLTRLLAPVMLAGLLFTNPLQSKAQEVVPQDDEIKQMVDQISAKNLRDLVQKMENFGTRHSLSTTTSKKEGIGAAREWVKSEFEKYAKNSNGRMTVEMDRYIVKADGRRIPQDVEMANVMAILKGTDPNDDRVIIVGGHLDSRATDVMDAKSKAPGANDDASGVAMVMEMARIMASKDFPATLVFVAFQGEEQGLYGSRHLAERAKKENWNLVAMLNNDIVGNSYSAETGLHDNTTVRVFSEGTPANETEEQARLRKLLGAENDSPSRNLARYMENTGEKYVDQMDVVLVHRTDRFLRGGDHTPFNQNGFAAVRMSETNEDFDHQHQDVRKEDGKQYGDLIEYMDFEYLRKNTGVNLATMASLGWAPAAPEEVGVITSNLTNKTDLKWKAPSKGQKPAGYYVLMRETNSPAWEKKFFVKDTKATLPYSKDNYFFAVQAVDAEGHASLPVLPVPVR